MGKDLVKKEKLEIFKDRLYVCRKEKTEENKIVNVFYLIIINHYKTGKTYKNFVFIAEDDFNYYKSLVTNDIK